MKLTVTRLEARETPAAFLGGGDLRLDSGVTVHPFGDWTGYLNVSQDQNAVYVGPGPGGGPRAAVLDPHTGSRIVGDRFFGDPASREGLVVIPPSELLPSVPEAPLTVGAGSYTVYLEAANAATVRYAAAHYAPVLDVIRVTDDPALAPAAGVGVTVRFNVPHEMITRLAGPGHNDAVGVAYEPGHEAWVQYPGTNLPGARVATHEMGHSLGLDHVMDDPDAIMAPYVGDQTTPLSAAEIETIREGLP